MPSRPPGGRMSRYRIVLAAMLLAAATGCSSGSDEASVVQGRARAEAAPAPPPASPFWVDPESDAARQIRLWQGQGRTADAQVLRRIADRPVAVWPSGDNPR